MKLKLFILFLLIFSLYACERQTTWEIQSEQINTVVVDAIITDEFKHQKIRLTKPFTDPNKEAIPVSGAQVRVRYSDTVVYFTENPDNPGTYLSDVEFAGSINITYHLEIDYNSETYTADTRMIPVNTSNPLSYAPVGNSDNLYEITYVAPQYNAEEQAMYEVIIDWTHLVNTTQNDTLTIAKLFYYTFNAIDVSYIILPQDKEEIFFPRGSIITETKYSLTDEYAAYLRALLAETEWQGSLFEEARGNLPTNISNKGLGYFSACSVISTVMVVQ
ncbi:MAG: DUF4249 domain-containing protein [Bacteroidales bacterium]|nr:DUF4249 domain-containing protein [Bacteroidales bacterium]